MLNDDETVMRRLETQVRISDYSSILRASTLGDVTEGDNIVSGDVQVIGINSRTLASDGIVSSNEEEETSVALDAGSLSGMCDDGTLTMTNTRIRSDVNAKAMSAYENNSTEIESQGFSDTFNYEVSCKTPSNQFEVSDDVRGEGDVEDDETTSYV